MNRLQSFTRSRSAWLILLMSAIALEAAALFFQYVMHLAPCVMCIYVRVAVLGLIIAAMVGLIAPKFWLTRILAIGAWGVSAAWGLKLSLELNKLQADPSPFSTCSFFPEFPTWMPLDKWLPAVFSPTGMCSDSPWTFLSVSMAQWMVVTFMVYLVVLAVMIIPAVKPAK
ncbi:disulfide bond formation protein DsbB [Shewanella sp. UCD-KL21]|uniref:disulfide bond formation protein DsbB n=1 Tax=Shewanella sp. UCD-KL21 TaxID=1917164 RepID=UPI0009711631|nr:disulfide bond formation protein DsbB [Shewanella sp. UCD-KL21]